MPGLKLMAELGLDGSGFQAGFNKAKIVAEGVSAGIKGFVIQAVGIATVEEAIRRTVETAKELVETSERLAIAPEQLQVLRQAAKDSNVEFEKLVSTFEKLDVARQKALIPGKEGVQARRAFGAAGIGPEQLREQSMAQLFTGPLHQMVMNRNPEEIGVIFRELGIKAFGGLVPVLRTNFEELEAHMKTLGSLMDAKTAVAVKGLGDEFSLLSQIIISNFAPALVFCAEKLFQFAGLAQAAFEWWKRIFKGPEPGQMGPAGTPVPGGFLGSLEAAVLRREAKGDIPGYSKEYVAAAKAFTEKNPVIDEANAKYLAVTEKWDAQLKAMQEKIAEEAARLSHQAPANFDQPTLGPKLSKKDLTTPTDSLVRIGNFLGSGSNTIAAMNEKKIQLLSSMDRKLGAWVRPTNDFAGNSGDMHSHFPKF